MDEYGEQREDGRDERVFESRNIWAEVGKEIWGTIGFSFLAECEFVRFDQRRVYVEIIPGFTMCNGF